jgi:hypothetical protein
LAFLLGSVEFEAHAVESPPSRLGLFSGLSNSHDLLDLMQGKFGRYEPYPIVGLNYSRRFLDAELVQLEWSGQVVKHLESWSLFEFDAFAVARWKWFPWNDFVITSLGFGDGLSLTTDYPSSETVSQNIRSRFLIYLWIDLRLTLPQLPEWSLDFIIHHRSGGYGLIGGVSGGSNYLCIGVTRVLPW